jgi:hypothetical protein
VLVCCYSSDSGVSAYGPQAQALYSGSVVVAATADATSAEGGLMVAAGSSLFRVTLTGGVTRVGAVAVQLTPLSFVRVVPTGLAFVGTNAQCVGAGGLSGQGERVTVMTVLSATFSVT